MSYASQTFNKDRHTIYTPLNEDKYTGKEYPVCRSSWENTFCQWCDKNPSVLKWSSEALQISYFDPVKRKNRRYYPDFTMSVKDVNGKISNYVIEIKPYEQTILPTQHGNKKSKTYMYEFCTYQINLAKWKAAIDFCRKHGLIFKLLTEKDLYKGK